MGSIGSINKVFSMIESKLGAAGYKEENIVKDFPLGSLPHARAESSHQKGGRLVKTIVDNIQGIIIEKKRPLRYKPLPRRKPISRIKVKRKDGVVQHYHKRLE